MSSAECVAGEPYSSPSRAASREATATDEEPDRGRERRARHASRRAADPYYDGEELFISILTYLVPIQFYRYIYSAEIISK